MRVANDLLLEETEMRLLLHGIRDCYGFDFQDYDPAWVRSRIWDRACAEEVQTVSGLQERVLHDPAVLERLLVALSVSPSRLFADIEFCQAFRCVVVPILRTYPYAQIWQPACSSGEDVLSLAIILEEEGLSGRARVYATDFSEAVFSSAREGLVATEGLAECDAAYRACGGRGALDQYFVSDGSRALLKPELRALMTFSEHNLATDDVFNEFQVIVARGILPVFNPALQRRVHAVFLKSLSRFGVLCIDRKDAGLPAEYEHEYQDLVEGMNIYRKVERAG